MDFAQLTYFRTLAQLEHMTCAANALHIAQPALSRALRKLEEELGLKLFNREGKHIRLNENGRTFLTHVEKILGELEEAKSVLADRKEKAKNQVSISMYAATQLLPAIIQGFQKMHPDIALVITQQDLSAGGQAEKCDILIDSTTKKMKKSCSVTLLEEEICLAMPVSHPLSERQSVRLIEVAQAPFICLHKGSGLRTATDAYCLKAGFLPKIVLESDSPAMVRDLIALGVGLAFIPKITWRGIDSGSNLKLVDIEEPRCIRYIHMTWRENRYQSEASQLFAAYLRDFFERI